MVVLDFFFAQTAKYILHMFVCVFVQIIGEPVIACRGVTHVLWGVVYMCVSVCTLCDADVSPLGDICEKCDPMDHSVQCSACDGPMRPRWN